MFQEKNIFHTRSGFPKCVLKKENLKLELFSLDDASVSCWAGGSLAADASRSVYSMAGRAAVLDGGEGGVWLLSQHRSPNPGRTGGLPARTG